MNSIRASRCCWNRISVSARGARHHRRASRRRPQGHGRALPQVRRHGVCGVTDQHYPSAAPGGAGQLLEVVVHQRGGARYEPGDARADAVEVRVVGGQPLRGYEALLVLRLLPAHLQGRVDIHLARADLDEAEALAVPQTSPASSASSSRWGTTRRQQVSPE